MLNRYIEGCHSVGFLWLDNDIQTKKEKEWRKKGIKPKKGMQYSDVDRMRAMAKDSNLI